MKIKTVLLLISAFIFLTFFGCKKKYDYNCKCKFDNGQTYNETYYSDITKAEAENKCSSKEQAINSIDTISDVSCSIQ